MTQMRMRPSKVLEKLRSGKTVNCIKLNIADSRVFEIASMCGFDCLWADMEHVPNNWSDIERQVLASKVYGVDLLVRVSRGGYSDYIKPLELDASGIMVPHIMGYEDAKNVVNMTRFYPLGRRPLDGGNADGAYCGISLEQYIEDANSKRFVFVQIEDPEPLDELDKIASLGGIDMLFFGPADFSQGIGTPGQWDNPAIADARKRVAEAALKHGKFAGTVGTPDNLDELIETGYRFFSIGADVVGLNQYFSDILSRFEKGEERRQKGIYGGDVR